MMRPFNNAHGGVGEDHRRESVSQSCPDQAAQVRAARQTGTWPHSPTTEFAASSCTAPVPARSCGSRPTELHTSYRRHRVEDPEAAATQAPEDGSTERSKRRIYLRAGRRLVARVRSRGVEPRDNRIEHVSSPEGYEDRHWPASTPTSNRGVRCCSRRFSDSGRATAVVTPAFTQRRPRLDRAPRLVLAYRQW